MRNIFNYCSCHTLDARGLTLVELLIVMVLSSVLMLAVYMSYQMQQRAGLGQHQVVDAQQDLRAVADIIESDIRAAGRSFSVPSTVEGVRSGSGPAMLLTRSLNTDGSVNDVSYRLDGSNLERNASVLLSNCQALSFAFFDNAGAQIVPSASGGILSDAQRKQVRSIRFDLELRTARVDPDTGQYLSRSFVRNVRCRNLEINQAKS